MTIDKPSDKQVTEAGVTNQSDKNPEQSGNSEPPNSETIKPSESGGLLYDVQTSPYIYSTEIETNGTSESPPPPPSTPIASPLIAPLDPYYRRHRYAAHVNNVNYSIVCEIYGIGPEDEFEDVNLND
ncbi:unnamed protein product [Ambrosiozyma monospora]|uniref:Unnamed protein product n=1 Tax=Ambrosiozyma monospora TaxID=43982 RepID=A0A9W7DI12_AMBMO|nr:unnamed protein product [Ambrosiozyma monospora]